MSDLAVFSVSLVGLFALVGLGEALRSLSVLQPEASRRMVHAGVGLFVVMTPLLFSRPHFVYLMGVVFVVLNGWALRRGYLNGIHGIERPSVGTVTFPLALLVVLSLTWAVDESRIFALQVAFLILAVSDPLAAAVGQRVHAPHRYRLGRSEKTLEGSLAFAVSAALICLAAVSWLQHVAAMDLSVAVLALVSVSVGVVGAAVEALAERGWDNLFVVLAVSLLLVFVAEHPADRAALLAAIPAGAAFGWGAHRLRFLDASGAVAGALFAMSVLGLGGWQWAVPSFAFFIFSSLLSRAGRGRKAAAQGRHAKGDVRDAGQVYANGGVAWALLLAYVAFPTGALYWGFLGAFAAAAADTWATEIGMLSRSRPLHVLTLRRVSTGTSGAISATGTAGALAGAAMVWLVAWPFSTTVGSLWSLLAVVGGGFAGSAADSVAGASIQAVYRRPDGTETERAEAGHVLVRGRRWMDNDRVNVLCTLIGAAWALACFHLAFSAS